MSLSRLQPRHRKFVNLCIETGNNTEAYMKAFPKVKDRRTAAANANRLLKDPLVADYYAKRREELEAKGIATAEEVMRTFTEILRRTIPDYSVQKDGDICEHPAKLADILRAGEALLKRLDKAAEERTRNDERDMYGVILMPETEQEGDNSE